MDKDEYRNRLAERIKHSARALSVYFEALSFSLSMRSKETLDRELLMEINSIEQRVTTIIAVLDDTRSKGAKPDEAIQIARRILGEIKNIGRNQEFPESMPKTCVTRAKAELEEARAEIIYGASELMEMIKSEPT